MYMYNLQLVKLTMYVELTNIRKSLLVLPKHRLFSWRKYTRKLLWDGVSARVCSTLASCGGGGGGGGQQGCIRFQENFKESSTDILSYYYVNLQLISPHCNKDSVHRLWLISHTCTYIIILGGLLFTLAHTVTAWIKHMGIKFTTTKPLSHCLACRSW